MKFAQHLFYSTVPEWANEYLQYKVMKKHLNVIQGNPNRRLRGNRDPNDTNESIPPELIDGLAIGEVDFIEIIASELEKVNTFYLETLKTLHDKFDSLKAKVTQIMSPTNFSVLPAKEQRKIKNKVKSFFFTLYREMVMLRYSLGFFQVK